MTLSILLLILFAALLTTVIFRRLELPVVLGYLVAGALMGRHALGLIPDTEEIQNLAEFGIVFLMFTIGLEFSLPKLLALKKAVFWIGGMQVLICIAGTFIIGKALGMTYLAALVVGGIVAMSSTAIVVKQLNDQSELHSAHGLNAVGILLFQDIAVIPFIILIASLSSNDKTFLPMVFLIAFFKGLVAVLLIMVLGRYLLKPAFYLIAKTRAIELFTLTVLLITLTAAWLTHFLGLSYALGAFVAGIMLGETEFRHQIEIEIRPFRDILLGLFFITIGMLANITQWVHLWPWISLLLVALVFCKLCVIASISRLVGETTLTSIRTGLILAQGGEFGFAILTFALKRGMVSASYGQVILAALLISIAASPLLIHFNKVIAGFFAKDKPLNGNDLQEAIRQHTCDLTNHIIICGFGRVGQHIGRVLDKTGFTYVGLDIDSTLIKNASLSGENVIFGDASHPGILDAAGVNRSKAVVISFDNINSTVKTVSLLRQKFPALPILVRCKDEIELNELKNYKPTKIIAEIYEESLTLSQHLLQLLELSTHQISNIMYEMRNQNYSILRGIFSGTIEEDNMFLKAYLSPILISEAAYAIGHRLGEFHFVETEVIGIRRGQNKPMKPENNIVLKANDIIILYGSASNIEDAEQLLIKGP